jgi:hypothetical protein
MMPDYINTDWLDFNIKIEHDSQLSVVHDVLQSTYSSRFVTSGKGFRGGYTDSASFLGGKAIVAWSPLKPKAGVFCSFPSSSLNYYAMYSKDPNYLLSPFYPVFMVYQMAMELKSFFDKPSIFDCVKVKRWDIAYDDNRGLVQLPKVESYTLARSFVSKFTEGRSTKGTFCPPGKRLGHTIYFGSSGPDTDTLIRIYDKSAEQQLSEDVIWNRVELQMRGDMSNTVSQYFLNQYLSGSDCWDDMCGFLKYKLDFKVMSSQDTNMTRRYSANWWSEFLESGQKLSVKLNRPDNSLDDKEKWLSKQVAPTIATISAAKRMIYGTDIEFLSGLITSGTARMGDEHYSMISDYIQFKKEGFDNG